MILINEEKLLEQTQNDNVIIEQLSFEGCVRIYLTIYPQGNSLKNK